MDGVKDKFLFEQDIIDELGKIYDLYIEYVAAEDKYIKSLDNSVISMKEMIKNCLGASFVSVFGFELGEYLSGNDAGMLYCNATVIGATALGSFVLNHVSKKELSFEEREALKLVLNRIELHKRMILGMIKKCVEDYNFEVDGFDFKDELFWIFGSNVDYIVSGIRKGVFDVDFNYENVCEALDYLIGDEDIYDFLENGKVNKMRIR